MKRTSFFVLRTTSWKKNEIGIGFVVSKKGIDKRAVIRNRVKRRLRALTREILSKSGKIGTAYVFYARKFALDSNFSEMKKSLKQCLNL